MCLFEVAIPKMGESNIASPLQNIGNLILSNITYYNTYNLPTA